MISNKFTVEDIHNLRNKNYEKTKSYSHAELIEDANSRAKGMIEKLKNLKEKQLKRINRVGQSRVVYCTLHVTDK